jgi:hypothetical protein
MCLLSAIRASAEFLTLCFADPDLWIHPNDSAVVTINAGEIVESPSFSAAGLTLRFPRIVRVRRGADSKDPSEIESNESLWEKYIDVQKSRSNTSTAQPQAFEVGSPTASMPGRNCRFLTETQLQLSRKTRKTVTSTRRKLYTVELPPEPERIGSILKDITFAVLGETGFGFEDGSIDVELAKEEGWFDESETVSKSGIVSFIKKHGGRYKISADSDCMFILGGSCEDRQVITFIQAIENARSQTLGKRLKTKIGQSLERMAEKAGVLRWTYVYSLVHDWLSSGHTMEESIQDKDPKRLLPSILDYLAVPSGHHDSSDSFDPRLFEADLSHVSKMRRALTIAEEIRAREPSIKASATPNWRSEGMERLKEEDRWVVACEQQTLWPYSHIREHQHRVTLYPDIFDDVGTPSLNLATSEWDSDRLKHMSGDLRSSWLSSVLPMARIMGAFVVSHLHHGVTHVLCDLADDKDEIPFTSSVKETVFLDCDRGRKVLTRLSESWNHRDVMLISPGWIRKRKWHEG